MPLTHRAAARRRSAGLTAVETAVSSAIVIVGLGVAGRTAVRMHSNERAIAAVGDVDRRLDSALDRVLGALDNVAAATIANDLTLPGGSSTITFKEKTGWSADATVLGVATTLAWEADPRDPVNGRDDDGDGVTDQGNVVLSRAVGGQTTKTVLVGGVTRYLQGETADGKDQNANGLVDESGLCFSRAGDKLTVRITLARLGAGKEMVVRTLCGTVRVQD